MLLSVVVTIVESGEALGECLRALDSQEGAPTLEILVPYDDSVLDLAELQRAHPSALFLAMGRVATEHPLHSPAGQHELFDRRRAAGLARAKGELIAIVEDRGVPRPDWAAKFVKLHEQPYAVVGGAVECGIDHPLNWAVYFCDFSRYQLPFKGGPADYVTDVNICYKRSALEATKALWQQRYHETQVNWTLREQGQTLFLAPEVVVDQVRRNRNLLTMVSERYHWGRLFAYTRVTHAGPLERLKYLFAAPLLPAVLFARHGRTQLTKKEHLVRFVMVAPLVGALLVPWSVGEMVGYATGKA
ncbi:MAG TPA: glycosyltransferase [Polyangiales bacterium]